jgi:hypothetical protein
MLSAAPSLHSTTNGDADLKKKKTCRSAFLRAVIRLLLSLFRRPSALAEKNKRERKRNAQEHKITRSGNNSGTPFKRLAVTQPLKGKYTHTQGLPASTDSLSLSLFTTSYWERGREEEASTTQPDFRRGQKKKKAKGSKTNNNRPSSSFLSSFFCLGVSRYKLPKESGQVHYYSSSPMRCFEANMSSS